MNKGYQGLVLAASLFAIGCETKEDAEACEQYATYVCDCSDAAVAAQCDEAGHRGCKGERVPDWHRLARDA